MTLLRNVEGIKVKKYHLTKREFWAHKEFATHIISQNIKKNTDEY